MRFYFDINDDFFAAVDPEGAELPDVEAAEREAIAIATAVARDVFSSRGTEVLVIVRKDRQALFELRVTAARKDVG
ncbi:hypothetical protein IVB57_24115 [Bradyrhizobium sp. CW9]|jgi:uncharacterized protein DUF6894|uniref:DUF6894 family protein n=1 Tax=Bradyrhizobium sp. CW9 TaxID=2782689 RepID=UPI001FFB9442|nr:hypothetical protein [Bradyrhizobium sp. CW9]MCK1331406.1 hypothetical protein [Bradyrhizobium sp. CW9]